MQRCLSICALSLAALSSAPAQTLTPREVFYHQGQAAQAVKPAAKPHRAATKPADTDVTPVSPVAPVEPQAKVEGPGRSGAGYTLVSNQTGPLGLKYIILKREGPGRYTAVNADATFIANDHWKVALEVNDPGYLYVISKGSSGKWEVRFPSAEIDNGDNRVRPGKTYDVPAGAVFTMDQTPGTEQVFLVLSRQPVQDLEKLIYTLQDKQTAQPKRGEISRPLMAANINPIQDDVVDRLRSYARDLVIEKVDDSQTPPPDSVKKLEAPGGPIPPSGEKAVYVVNPNAGPDAHVVAEIELRHR